MPRLRVPLEELRLLGGQLQRCAADVLELDARLAADAGGLDPVTRQVLKLDGYLEQVRSQARQVSEGAEALARDARLIAAALDETDREAAASLPRAPRPSFLLPPAMPPKRPWPYAAPPVVTTVRVRGPSRAADPGGLVSPDDSGNPYA